MVIKKTTTCNIVLYDQDAISNIQVDKSKSEHDQLGLQHDSIDRPQYVCTTLHISGGYAANIEVQSNGYVELTAGTIKNLKVYPGGMAILNGGTATEVKELGGYVQVSPSNRGTVQFEPQIISNLNITHQATFCSGAQIISPYIHNYGCVRIFDGGICSSANVLSGSLVAENGGEVNGAYIKEHGRLVAHGGDVSNITVLSGGSIEIQASWCFDPDKKDYTAFFSNVSNVHVSSGGTVHLTTYEGVDVPKLDNIKIEDGAFVNTHIIYDEDNDENDEFKYELMVSGALIDRYPTSVPPFASLINSSSFENKEKEK